MSPLGRVAGAVAEAKARAKADAVARVAAGKAADSIILRPGDLQGEYDAFRALKTTLRGGQAREITDDDLAAFRQNIRTMGRRFKGGITPRQIIDLSLSVDRERARKEIHTAVAAFARGVKDTSGKVDRLEVRFITSVGPESRDTRHHVTVEFMGYPVAVASGAEKASKAASQMAKMQVRFDCDCKHHQYRRRYIATIGNYNAGRAENGFPKLTNPGLAGVACKHVLRVMAEIDSGAGHAHLFLVRAIEKGRKSEDGSGSIRRAQKDFEKQVEKQASRPMTNSARSGDADFDRSRAALRKLSRSITTSPKRAASATKRIGVMAGDPRLHAQLNAFVAGLGITNEEAIQMLGTTGRKK